MTNVTVLVGRITRDLELKQTTNGVSNARFSVAVNRPFAKKDSNEQQADFINCVAWRAQAENLVKYCGKGSLVAVQGSIQTGSYTDRDGKKVYTTDVVANNIQFLDSKSSTNNGQNGAYQQQNAPRNQSYNQQPSYTQYEQPSAPDNSDIESDLPF